MIIVKTECSFLQSVDKIVPVTISYFETEPLTVLFSFHHNDETIDWVLDRNLLRELFEKEESGALDVKFFLTEVNKNVAMLIRSIEGTAILIFEQDPIRKFTEEIYEAVPDGKEDFSFTDEDIYKWLEETH